MGERHSVVRVGTLHRLIPHTPPELGGSYVRLKSAGVFGLGTTVGCEARVNCGRVWYGGLAPECLSSSRTFVGVQMILINGNKDALKKMENEEK